MERAVICRPHAGGGPQAVGNCSVPSPLCHVPLDPLSHEEHRYGQACAGAKDHIEPLA